MAQQQVYTLAPEPRPAALTVEVISNPVRFATCATEWNRLVAESGVRHPFLSHTWLTTWWEHFGAGKTLQIFVVKRGADWIAAAPMMVHAVKMYGISLRRLDTIYNYHVPRSEFAIKERSEDVYRALWQAMSAKGAPWDVVALQQFPADSGTLSTIRQFATESGWSTGTWNAPSSPFVPLNCAYDDVLKRLGSKMRENLRRRLAKLAEVDTVDLEIISEPAAVAEAIEDGLRIEAAAWKGDAGTAILNDPDVTRFYRQLAQRAAHEGWVRLVFLRVGGKRIAFNYLAETNGVVFGLKIGYDPEFQTYSPGNMIRGLVLKDACQRGCSEFDFLGNPDDWKLAWTRETRPHQWLFAFRNRPKARLVHQAKFRVLPAVKRNERLMKMTNAIVGMVQCFQSTD